MKSARTYLDYNASAPLRPEARAAMLAALDAAEASGANASSVHAEGRRARALVEGAREDVARLIHARPSEVVFTSGATEANNWVMSAGFGRILVSGTEHDSVLAPAHASTGEVETLAVTPDGVLGREAVEMIRGARSRVAQLVSVQAANNETGVMQPLAAVVEAKREAGALLHTDAVQAAGRVPIDFAALGVDFMSLSSHKIGGPMGMGALVIRDGVSLASFLRGGGQERRRRAGTENVAAIAGFGAAARAAARDLADMDRLARVRDALESEVVALTPGAVVIGARAPRLPNTTCFALPGVRAETLVIKLDLVGIAVSAGSACSSGKVGPSHVLAAMGVEPEVARGAIRLSLGHATREEDITAFLGAWRTLVRQADLAA